MTILITRDCLLQGLQTREQLIQILNCDSFLIDEAGLERLQEQTDRYMEQVVITDDLTGKRRNCEVPPEALKKFQERIHQILLAWLDEIMPGYLFSFRSPLENARYHANTSFTVTLDIQKFFRSTSHEQVYGLFANVLGMSPELALLLTDLCTYKGHLPTGSPTSPILSFLAYWSMWDMLDTLCLSSEYLFSLLIDDITISGERIDRQFIGIVRVVLKRYNLRLAKGKTVWFPRDRTKRITGVMVSPEGRFSAPHSTHWRLNERIKQLEKAKTRKRRKQIKRKIKGLKQWIADIEAANSPT